jgi:hypothetical protein
MPSAALIAEAFTYLCELYSKRGHEGGAAEDTQKNHAYELAIYELGNEMETICRRYRKTKSDQADRDVILRVLQQAALAKHYGKGRRNFVLALGFLRAREQLVSLAELLDDHEVQWQMIGALRRAREYSFGAQVRRIAEQTTSRPMRRDALKYLERAEAQREHD